MTINESRQEVEFLHNLLRCIETLDAECRPEQNSHTQEPARDIKDDPINKSEKLLQEHFRWRNNMKDLADLKSLHKHLEDNLRHRIAHSLMSFQEYVIQYMYLLILAVLRLGKYDFVKEEGTTPQNSKEDIQELEN